MWLIPTTPPPIRPAQPRRSLCLPPRRRPTWVPQCRAMRCVIAARASVTSTATGSGLEVWGLGVSSRRAIEEVFHRRDACAVAIDAMLALGDFLLHHRTPCLVIGELHRRRDVVIDIVGD